MWDYVTVEVCAVYIIKIWINEWISCYSGQKQHMYSRCSSQSATCSIGRQRVVSIHIHTHTRLTALCPGLPRWAGTRKVKPIWILLKQETVSGSGIRWDICKSAPRSRQITMPAPHHSVFYRPDALPATQPTASKHWRHHRLQWFIHLYGLTA